MLRDILKHAHGKRIVVEYPNGDFIQEGTFVGPVRETSTVVIYPVVFQNGENGSIIVPTDDHFISVDGQPRQRIRHNTTLN